MATASIHITITKEQAMSAIRQMTVNCDDFRPGPWSLWDAEVLERAAGLIRREIKAVEKPVGDGWSTDPKDYAVTLCLGGDEPMDVLGALLPIHHIGADGRACHTPNDDCGYASVWRHPTREELAAYLEKRGEPAHA